MNKNVINNRTYRRFNVKGDAKKEQAAFALMERKGLSREDLILLLETYELNEQNILKQCQKESAQGFQKN